MELLEKISSSNLLNTEQIQDLMIFEKKHRNLPKERVDLWNKTIDTLWIYLENGLSKTDDQLLCATCFFSIISVTDKQNDYLIKTKHIIDKEIFSKSNGCESSNTLQAISLMYGMFQSSFLSLKCDNQVFEDLFNSVFKLLILIAYEYSQYTFMAIKTISAFKKVLGTNYEKIIFNKENQIVLLHMVNHNWENPITGVRDLIRGVFQTLLMVMGEDLYNIIIRDINSYYWNKAKYLMLSEIIEHTKEDISMLIINNNWLEGLINSLFKTGLVSAGADMYYAVLKKINSEEAWCNLFMKNIIKVLNGTSYKAIENFNNYWCLTTLKKFPSIMNTILDEMRNVGNNEEKLFSVMFVMKQGNKLGILNKKWESNSYSIEKLIIMSLEHCNTHIRMLAFDIICLSHVKVMPKKVEYDLIIDYLKNNTNSDCTVLRLNLLSSLNTFLTQLHILFRNLKDHNLENIQLMEDFCTEIQEFIVWSLNLDGNYQRKIASVKVLNTFVTCLSEIPRKKKQQTRETGQTLIEYLKDKKTWILHGKQIITKLVNLLKDPSDDIRENVLKILLNNYSAEFDNDGENYFSLLVEDALRCRESKFFYDINCSQVMFKLIVSLLVKNDHLNTDFKNVADVFNYSYNELVTEYKLKKDILSTIEKGKQLHSYISILQVIFEACLSNSYRLDIANDKINVLLNVLEGVTDQFTWENNSTSSDFSKMNDMVESIIAESGCVANDKDDTKISSLHQIVLNCLWLNVKASCDLAALLIQFHSTDEGKCTKCLNIITHVLETSRHKGAIEAAGTALGKSIQYLTTLPEDSNVSKLPQTLLKTKLNVLILEASKMASITRRGAGLSIMVHRIVSSDMQKGKPLFHYFMKTLLTTCKNAENVPKATDLQNIENQMDLPKAILIHFLTKIVTDSSLASDMMFYSAKLAELAFGNLTSPHWQIRNAALQLYGALIPKLIGQKKASGNDDETIATVGYDELRTHSPKLWMFITEQLKCQSNSEILTHSNLVPILNLLASVAMRYNFTSDLIEQKLFDEELLKSLFQILDSPIHTVRRLTAKCIFNIFPFEQVYEILLHADYCSENYLHGSLLVVKNYFQYYEKQGLYCNELKNMKEMFSKLLSKGQHSYWSKEVYENIGSKHYSFEEINSILSEVDSNSPGSYLWANTCIKRTITNSNWNNMLKIIQLLLNQNDFEFYCEYILVEIEKDMNIPSEVLTEIANILLSFEKKFESTLIWKILYLISTRTKIDIDPSHLLKESKVDEKSYKLRYLLPFLATQFLNIDEFEQQIFQEIVYKMSNFEISDVDIRFIAVLCNNEIAKFYHKLSDIAKLNALKTTVLLLQDEDEDVRNEAVHFYKTINNLTVAVHPYICLKNILHYDFLKDTFTDTKNIKVLCEKLLSLLSNNVHNAAENYNPFANDSKNIYIEINVIEQTLKSLCQ